MLRPHAQIAASTTFAEDVLAGLGATPRSVPPKYFYDAAGSALFDRICDLPEYYPTRTELNLLTRYGAAMAQQIGPDAELVEFGAGSLTKVRLLLDAFAPGTAPRRYFPLDISAGHLAAAAERLRADYPQLEVEPVAADYLAHLTLPPVRAASGRRVGFFPGSTIGNFSPAQAHTFLRRAAGWLAGGGLLVGVDLVKDPALLHAAYNDAQGITAQFNLNLLRRMNRELAADFDLNQFAHYAFYQPLLRRVEMHLVSQCAQSVQLAGHVFSFAEGETLHTENSYKFTLDGFRAMALAAGFRPGPVWTDEAKLFSVHWLEAPGG
ncbi:L-histidine N(alpha)-methyltransferase [Paraburkholderia bonniea]|uniref:L-histidine N(alpha)-methyltransferase n=1 Tax=Paraburkholderia bonniea TaxID=2152891 RepID=UPI0012922F69|nr:L-histidine N(alpha)-methyltransferase [Paraburkholderia bonniea]WJF92169.1 L-histidine N(alpha)-methyltransferase [Paraburkholderia bonniea]WJF95489.1 L-histidine N(alpha)-methyltransferase [Paraburkholderia bonniea]